MGWKTFVAPFTSSIASSVVALDQLGAQAVAN